MADKTMRVVLIGDNTSLRGVLRASATEVKTFATQVEQTAVNTKFNTNLIGKSMAAMSAIIIAAFVASGFAAMKFEADMRNVATISPYVQKNFDQVSDSLVRMSTQLPQSASTLAKGLYDVASSGFAGASGIKVLEVSAKAASAGLTDTATSARVITGVLNAYGLGADQARAVSDVLFQTVNLGVVTFEELAQSLGQVSGLAAQAKIPLSDLGAAYATITLSGIPAAESSTALKRVIQSFIDPSKALRDKLLELGYASGEQAIKSDGLRVVLQRVKESVHGNVQAFSNLFPEIRAATGALALTANNGRTWDRVARQMGDATAGAGATQRALAQQSQSLSYQLSLTKNRVMALAIELGRALLPAIKLANNALQEAIGFVSSLPGPVKTVVMIIALLTAGALALGAAMLLLAPRIAATKAALVEMGVAGSAMQTLATGAAKVAMVAAGLTIAVASFKQIGTTAQGTTTGILGMVAAGAMIGGAFGPWGAAIGAAAGGVIGLTKAIIVGSESLEEYHKKFVQVAQDAQGVGAKQAAQDFISKLGFTDKAGAGLAKDTEYIKEYGAAWSSLKDQQVVNPVKALRNELETAARTSPAQAAKIVKGLADIRAEAGNPLSKKEIEGLNAVVDEGARKFAKSSQAKQREAEIDRMVASGAMTEKQAIAALGNAADGATSDVLGLTGAQKQLQKVLQQYTNPNDAFKAAVSQRAQAMKDALQAQADAEKELTGQVSTETQSQIDALNNASGAWYDFKNSATQSLSDFIAELAKQNYATLTWQSNLIEIAKRGGRDFAEQLMQLGPEAAPMIAQIATATEPEFQEVKRQFGVQGQLAGDEFTKKLDEALNTPVAGTLNGIKQLPAEVQSAVQQTAINLKGSIANMKDDLDNGVIGMSTFKEGVAGGVGSLLNFATQAGLSGEAAVRYAEDILGIPKEARTKIENSADPARTLVEYYTAKILGIPLKWATTISADTTDVWKIDTLLAKMRELSGTPWVVSVGVRAPSSVSVAQGGSNPFILPEATGGVLRFYADGAHVAQIAPRGTSRIWNEPETGGESYIPLGAHKRSRSTRILGQTADMFGYSLVRKTRAYANGGINGRGIIGATATSRTVMVNTSLNFNAPVYGEHSMRETVKDIIDQHDRDLEIAIQRDRSAW